MRKSKNKLGTAAKNLNLKKAMRSRISDTLTPPPRPPGSTKPAPEILEKIAEATPVIEKKYNPRFIAERIWMNFMGKDNEEPFEVKFLLGDHREFELRGDKEGFGTIQTLEPFDEVHEKLLEVHHKNISKVEVFTDLQAFTFGNYNDFLEWLDL